ncbi:MAG: universal stress protein [candidate division KSB1 bacterium]|nr:universal stress protein [candidate division KSB1 bacterium]
MFKTIMIATDLSPASDAILKCANGFRLLGAETIFLCHALGLRHLEDLKYSLIKKAEPKLVAQKKILEQQGLQTIVEIAPGIPSEEINRIADEKKVSLIVIGTHGESLASHLLFKFGGVASEVLHSHSRPLLLVRTQVTEDRGEVCCEASCADFRGNVLYNTDFSDTAYRAFEYLEQIVAAGCKKVTLLHVQDQAHISKHLEHKLEEFNRIDTERLEMLKSKLIEKGAKDVRIKIPYGHSKSEILKESQENNYSLIVMGSQGRGFIKEIFLGSVSCHVARYARQSVLLVPALR